MTHISCVCGARFAGATHLEAWQLFDAHVDADHGRRFPLGKLPTQMGRYVNLGRVPSEDGGRR